MGLGQRLLGGLHGPAGHGPAGHGRGHQHGDGLIRRPRGDGSIPITWPVGPAARAARVANGGRLLIAEFRSPHGRLSSHLTGLLAGPAMRENPIDGYVELVTQAGFTMAGRGDRRPLLTYLVASRPVAEQGHA